MDGEFYNGIAMVLVVLGSGFCIEKGRREFIEMAGNEACQIILVGLTPEQAKGLPDNIIVVNRTSSQRELAQYYTAADVLLNPTYNDTFPTVNLEALACGTPVITYRTGGSPEAIDEKTGWVVPKGDVASVAWLVSGFRFQVSGSAMREACRKRAEEHFDKDRCFEKYIALYETLV